MPLAIVAIVAMLFFVLSRGPGGTPTETSAARQQTDPAEVILQIDPPNWGEVVVYETIEMGFPPPLPTRNPKR